ncbi:MAG: DNA translocase FtsK 4TM domain-containing protein [Alloprevotella sp.]
MAKKTSPRAKKTIRNKGTTPAPLSFKQRIAQFNLKEYFKGDTVKFLIGFVLLAISFFMLLSFISNIFTGTKDQSGVRAHDLTEAANYGGILGAYVSDYFMNECFGLVSFFIPLFFLMWSVKLMGAYKVRLWKWFLNYSILMIWFSVTFSLLCKILPETITNHFSFRPGGGHGVFIVDKLSNLLGTVGACIVVLAVAVFYLMYITSETMQFVRRLLHPQDAMRNPFKRKRDENEETEEMPDDEQAGEDDNVEEDPISAADDDSGRSTVTIDLSVNPEEADGSADELPLDEVEEGDDKVKIGEPDITITPLADNDKAEGKTVEDVAEMEPYDPRKDLENYKYPTISLLKHYDDAGNGIDMEEQNANKNRIIEVLKNFGVEITHIKATIGPTITLYEVTPAPGVRINRIRNLEDDIALSLSAIGIRIIAPIPGKGTIGIEVPNKKPQIVSMESIINTKKFQDSTFELPIALGKTITNEVFMVDLAKAPHLLVAGATGMGKSVGLNAIITSLLYKKHPAELKFVMVDPKKVEFSIYAPIENHFLAKIPDEAEDPIITDVTKVVQTLKSLCQLMDHRYDLLKKAKVRNIKEYNAKFKARQLNPENGHEFMPYIVIIIDEFGDLIMTAGKEVELPIARIAQLARAVGMHMIIATQRPTTNIITGTIKANFPARIAFKVTSQIDSRTILDQGGAQQLVGKGDMLYLGTANPIRVQCAFVDTPEVEEIVDHVCRQQGYLSAFELPEPEIDADSGSNVSLDTDALDPMFEEAARLIVVHQQGSTSLIQRKFAIGYNRAGRLMDQLEHAGIVGPIRGAKPREVLIADEIELDSKIALLKGM